MSTSVLLCSLYLRVERASSTSPCSSSRTMMRVSSFTCLFCCSFVSPLFAKPLVAVSDQTLQSDLNDVRQPSQSPNLNLVSPVTPSVLNTSLSKDATIKCDGDEYGFNPDVDDCTSALARQSPGRTRLRFGQRGSVSTEEFFPLPYRLMGGLWPRDDPLTDPIAFMCQANGFLGRRSALLLATGTAERGRVWQCNSKSTPRGSVRPTLELCIESATRRDCYPLQYVKRKSPLRKPGDSAWQQILTGFRQR